MATGVEAALIGLVGGFLKKPFEDFYTSATGSVKGFAKAWIGRGAVSRIVQSIEDLERIRTIVSRQVSTLSEIYYPAKVLRKNRPVNVVCVGDVSLEKNILITGTAGQGKSVLMRYLTVQELRLEARIPVFIELRRIDKATDLSKLLRIQLGLKEDGTEDEISEHLFKQGKVVLLLDGFDEVPREFAIALRDKLFDLASKYKGTQLVISSRPGALCAHIQDLPNLISVEVAELAEADFRPFLQKIGTSEEVIQRLITAINTSSTEVKRLLKTPLMLTLLVLTCGGKQQIPDTLPEFYDSLFRVLAVMHDETKPGYVREMATKLTFAELEQVFECFAFVSREKFDRTSLSPAQFEESVKEAVNYTGKQCTSEGFRTDVSETVCLMVREGIDTTFIHKSIQEYYTARFIKSMPDNEAAIDAYNAISEMRLLLWSSEIKFLEQIDPIRFKVFFRRKQVENFLRHCGYRNTARKLITKAALTRCLKYFFPVKVSTGWVLSWNGDAVDNLDSILFQEVALPISKSLGTVSQAAHESYPTFIKMVEELPDLYNAIVRIFEQKIKSALRELEEIEKAERQRKGALLNILKKKRPN